MMEDVSQRERDPTIQNTLKNAKQPVKMTGTRSRQLSAENEMGERVGGEEEEEH